MTKPYHINIYDYSYCEKKYILAEEFFPGTISLSYIQNFHFSTNIRCLVKEKGFYNPFSKNFLTKKECIQHRTYTANAVSATLEHSIWENDPNGYGRYIQIARFWDLTHDKFKGETKYPLYMLAIDGKEYDMEMLKYRPEYYNMVLTNKYNEYCLEELG